MINYFIVRIITHPIMHELAPVTDIISVETFRISQNKNINLVTIRFGQLTLEICGVYRSHIMTLNQFYMDYNYYKSSPWNTFCILRSQK